MQNTPISVHQQLSRISFSNQMIYGRTLPMFSVPVFPERLVRQMDRYCTSPSTSSTTGRKWNDTDHRPQICCA